MTPIWMVKMSKSNPFFKDVTVPGTLVPHRTEATPDGKPDGDSCKILIVAGVHGNEHNAVLAAYRLYRELKQEHDPKCRNKHDIRFILGVNTWGLLKNRREWASRDDVHPDPISQDIPVDFNHVFTTGPVSGVEKEDAADIKRLIENAIASADVVIDVHNSPACDDIVLLNNDEYTASTIKFLNEIHMPNYMVWESQTSTIKKYAIDHGKTGFTVELGGMTLSRTDDSVMFEQTAFLKTLVNMVDFFMPKFEKGPVLPPHMLAIPIYARAYGLIDEVKFSSHAKMKEGEVFATMVTDSDNPDDAVFKAPCEGSLVACQDTRFVKPGDEIFTWQPVINL